MFGARQLAHYCKLTFRQLLCWDPTPTCFVCRNWGSNFSMLGPRQLSLSVGIGDPISLCWGPPQLALFVEFLFEILCVGTPPTCIVCRNWESNFSMLGPRNYCKKVVTIVFSFNQLLLI